MSAYTVGHRDLYLETRRLSLYQLITKGEFGFSGSDCSKDISSMGSLRLMLRSWSSLGNLILWPSLHHRFTALFNADSEMDQVVKTML